jgi:hypothetical protein
MKAIQIHETGGPEVLRLAGAPIPQLGPDAPALDFAAGECAKNNPAFHPATDH